jgi:hypothetical protein
MRGSNRSLKVGKTGRRKEGNTERLKVKKTVSGKYSCLLTLELREHLFMMACEYADWDIIRLLTKTDLVGSMLHCLVGEMACDKNWLLQNKHDARILFKRSEAVALIWLTTNSRVLEVIDFRGELHKQLS